MNKGELRKEIMSDCPEDFKNELESHLNKIEDVLIDIVCELNISSISEIGQIEEAHRLADELTDALY